MSLDEFVVDGVAKVSASMFPTTVDHNSAGRSPARFMTVQHPDGSFYAMAWVASYTGEPDMFVNSKILEVHMFTSSRVSLTTEAGVVNVSPSGGGCCGSRLRSYNPFGPGVQLAHIPMTKDL